MKFIPFLVFFCLAQISSPKTIYNHFVTEKKEVALTFDDGPYKESTEKVLNILRNENVKATFFVLGESVEKNKPTLKKIASEGHSIGLHSFSHPNFHKMSYKEIKNEIIKNQAIIKDTLGYSPKIIRPPYGIITNNFLNVSIDLDLTIYTWSDDSFDWKKGNSPQYIVENVLKKVKPGQIILMHDKSANSSNSIKALPIIIKKLKSNGYSFVTLSIRK